MIYYCISDIHGCLFAFQNALDIITSHLSEENTALILLGDYIHGGKENAAVLDKIMELQNRYGSGKVIALLGNHEELVCEGMWHRSMHAAQAAVTMTGMSAGCVVCRDTTLPERPYLSMPVLMKKQKIYGNTAPWIISSRKNILPRQDIFSRITKSLPDISALLRSLEIRTFTGSILTAVLTIILMRIRWRLAS